VVMLVYLHGRGEGDPGNGWMETLEDSLQRVGYPGLDAVEVIAPEYADILRGTVAGGSKLPPVTARKLSDAELREVRRGVERRTARLEALLGANTPGPGAGVADPMAGVVADVIEQVRNYLDQDAVRAAVLQSVLAAIPRQGEVVIVGHSLGSIIAIDLVRRLQAGVKVRGLVTIGSPAGYPDLHRLSDRLVLKTPVEHIDWWVNFWNDSDPVTGFRGLGFQFPWLLDQRLSLGACRHKSRFYLAAESVAFTVGRALFGPLERSVAVRATSPDVRLDEGEIKLLLWLAYAHAVHDHLKGETQERFGSALEVAQHEVIGRVLATYRQDGVRVPQDLADLQVTSLGAGPCPRPKRLSPLSKDEAVEALLAVAMLNPVRPYEIKTPDSARREALRDVSAFPGLGGLLGQNADEAIKEAMGVVHPNGAEWLRWTAVGVGIAMLAAGPVGLILAAPAGLAGGAAIVAALAAFGPGGMIGGLVTAGIITTGGAGTIAHALASSSTSVEEVETYVVHLLASMILRDREKLTQDLGHWLALSESARQIQRALARLAPYSDEKAPTVVALEKKLKAIDRAMDYIVKNGFLAQDFDGSRVTQQVPARALSGVVTTS
jgi:pimeloyl-ACP methyl ester carboxylesterase